MNCVLICLGLGRREIFGCQHFLRNVFNIFSFSLSIFICFSSFCVCFLVTSVLRFPQNHDYHISNVVHLNWNCKECVIANTVALTSIVPLSLYFLKNKTSTWLKVVSAIESIQSNVGHELSIDLNRIRFPSYFVSSWNLRVNIETNNTHKQHWPVRSSCKIPTRRRSVKCQSLRSP